MNGRQSDLMAHDVSVRACKYDGSEHRRWNANLTDVQGSMIVLTGAFEKEVRHPLLGTIVRGTESVEYYWTDRWYSVFRFTEPSGELRNYYCNVNKPTTFDGSVLTFVDLDIDILVTPEFAYTVLDEDEFAENANRYGYPDEVRQRVQVAVSELIGLLEAKQFPFSGSTGVFPVTSAQQEK